MQTPPSATVKESDSPVGEDIKPNGLPPAGASSDKPQKPHRPLNRVPRACNACRKQKMKCTDADNPPCKRCRHAGIECIFEKPIRDTLNNSEQGMWRIRNLETQVSSMQSTLAELVHTLRAAVPNVSMPSPSSLASSSTTQHPLPQPNHPTPPQQPQQPSPVNYSAPSPALSANSGGVPPGYSNGATSEVPGHPNHPHNYPHNGVSGPPRPYRSTSSSSGRTIGYQSSPGAHPQHMSPSMSGPPPNQQHPDHLFRSNSDSQYPDHRSQPHPQDQYPPSQPHHHSSVPQYPPVPHSQQNTHHPGSQMPPPTSLPPFSALDVPSGSHRPVPPALHMQSGARQPFMPVLSPRKNSHPMSSPTSSYNGYGGSSSHQSYPVHSPQSNMNPAHPHYPGSLSQYPDSTHPNDTKHDSSNVTSADSSDDEGPPSELPTHGMIAPFVAIRGLADVADRVAEENGGESDPPTRSGSPSRSGQYDAFDARGGSLHSPVGYSSHRLDGRNGKRASGKAGDLLDRPSKRRKTQVIDDATETPARAVPDVVTKGIISEEEARELFNIFFTGCSMFLPVFDAITDTYDALHKRSPFCVDAICMVAAKVRDGGGPPSETYKKCLKEVHDITCATLFAPVVRQEVVQAMILVAGWGAGPKDSGWLTCGHATRMALELGMHKAWPKLMKRMNAGKTSSSQDERELVISARTWFCLYLFEHQMSFGTGRPAVLKEDESVHECRLLLAHPLAIQDDMRLVSMVELMIIRERTQNQINPADNAPVDAQTFEILRRSKVNFEGWLQVWSNNFSKRYEAAAFHRRSLEAQVAFAELYHNAIALRTIRGPDDVARITDDQRELALRSMKVAQTALDVCLRSPSYREGMKYAVQYTHLSATFAASFLMRLTRLFPGDCNLPETMQDVEELVEILSEIPATRFARTLKLMLRTAKRRQRVPGAPRTSDQSSTSSGGAPRTVTTPTISQPLQVDHPVLPPHPVMIPPGNGPANATGAPVNVELDQFVRDFELMPGQDVPVWLSESNLGDLALSQQGLEAFLIPPGLDEQRVVPEIW